MIPAATGGDAKPADDAAEAGSPASPPGARWVEADKNVRETGKWIVTTVTASSGVVFASGGFLAKGEFGESYFWQRAWVMVGGATVAVLGLALFISRVVKTLTPQEPTLTALPKEVADDIETVPRDYFPEGVSTVAEFRVQY